LSRHQRHRAHRQKQNQRIRTFHAIHPMALQPEVYNSCNAKMNIDRLVKDGLALKPEGER
jgi:hypothetical protein